MAFSEPDTAITAPSSATVETMTLSAMIFSLLSVVLYAFAVAQLPRPTKPLMPVFTVSFCVSFSVPLDGVATGCFSGTSVSTIVSGTVSLLSGIVSLLSLFPGAADVSSAVSSAADVITSCAAFVVSSNFSSDVRSVSSWLPVSVAFSVLFSVLSTASDSVSVSDSFTISAFGSSETSPVSLSPTTGA